MLAYRYLVVAFSALGAGVLSYYFGRSTPTYYEAALGISKPAYGFTASTWLPDFCWAMSFFCVISYVWKSWAAVPALLKYFCIIAMISTEILQYLHYIPGTGDLLDMFVYLLAFILMYMHKFVQWILYTGTVQKQTA